MLPSSNEQVINIQQKNERNTSNHNVVDLGLVEASIDSLDEMLLEFEKIEYQYELIFVLTKLRENAWLLWGTLQ